MFPIKSFVPCVVSLCLGLGALGCRPEATISEYTIPKPESIQLAPPAELAGTSASGGQTAGKPERMLAAIASDGSQFWFFKVTGAVDAVATQVEPFKAFLQSLKFVNGEPTWELPAEWKHMPGSGMRFATLQIATTPPLELTVIALPQGAGELPPQILANINRWRGQLSLAPIDLAQLDKDTERVTTADNLAITFVDYTGKSTGGGMMNAPFAQGLGAPRPSPMASAPTASGGVSAEVKYDTPEGWRPGRTGGMRKAALEVGDGSQKAEITVIDLPEEAGDRLANINRWRGQVGLDPVDAAELAKSMREIAVGSLKGDYVELVGAASASKPQTILGVIVDHGGKAWFVKLQGDTELALAEKDNFETFVKSVRFE